MNLEVNVNINVFIFEFIFKFFYRYKYVLDCDLLWGGILKGYFNNSFFLIDFKIFYIWEFGIEFVNFIENVNYIRDYCR